MKALIVRLSAVGDVVHTLPCLGALLRHGWEAGWVVEPAGHVLLEGQPWLSHLAATPGARAFRVPAARLAIDGLRERHYDVALDFQGLWKSAIWARLSGATRLVGFARPWRREGLSSVLIRELVELPPDIAHVIDKNLALLRAIGIDAVGSREFPLPPSQRQSESVQRQLDELGLGPFAILNPGGGWPGKLWPPERYGTVARGLRERGFASLVSWGPGEERLADRVVAASDGAALRCFPTTLLEYTELAKRARLVLAADTGPLHIACAVGTPVVGIYGPTDPARNGPFSANDLVVRRTPLCSPCHKHRCDVHEGVMEAITASEVLRALDKRLEHVPSAISLAV